MESDQEWASKLYGVPKWAQTTTTKPSMPPQFVNTTATKLEVALGGSVALPCTVLHLAEDQAVSASDL